MQRTARRKAARLRRACWCVRTHCLTHSLMISHEALIITHSRVTLRLSLPRAEPALVCRTHCRPRAELSFHHGLHVSRACAGSAGRDDARIDLALASSGGEARPAHRSGRHAIRNRAQPVPRRLTRLRPSQATPRNLRPRRRQARVVLSAARRLPTGRPGPRRRPRRRPRRFRSRERRRSVKPGAGVAVATRKRSGYACSSERGGGMGPAGHRTTGCRRRACIGRAVAGQGVQ